MKLFAGNLLKLVERVLDLRNCLLMRHFPSGIFCYMLYLIYILTDIIIFCLIIYIIWSSCVLPRIVTDPWGRGLEWELPYTKLGAVKRPLSTKIIKSVFFYTKEQPWAVWAPQGRARGFSDCADLCCCLFGVTGFDMEGSSLSAGALTALKEVERRGLVSLECNDFLQVWPLLPG